MVPVRGLKRSPTLQTLELRRSHQISVAQGEMQVVDITWELQVNAAT